MPVAVGVPLMVIVLLFQEAVNPFGNPVAAPIPVAPPVVIVMLGDKAIFTQVVREVVAEAVFLAITEMVPVAVAEPQPPDNGIE
jgi:hypothetical protein